VYWRRQDGRFSLNKVKTTGEAEPEVLKADVDLTGTSWVPMWSPSDDWILHSDGGAKLISPDGKSTRHLSSRSAVAYGFSADGGTVYGIRPATADRVELFSVSVATGIEDDRFHGAGASTCQRNQPCTSAHTDPRRQARHL
jgi:hypothetical protein